MKVSVWRGSARAGAARAKTRIEAATAEVPLPTRLDLPEGTAADAGTCVNNPIL
jgi:hypothetical protein